MSDTQKIIKIFTLPQQFPCGPAAACCGPIGQTEEEIKSLTSAIESELNLKTEVIEVVDGEEMQRYPAVIRLLRSLGTMALPVITLDDEVVSIGSPKPEEAVLAIKEKLAN